MTILNFAKYQFSRFTSYLSYAFFRVLSFTVNCLSPLRANRLAEAVGSLLFLRKRRRRFCTQNLNMAFPEKSAREIQKIGRASMQAMVKVIFEFIRMPGIFKKTSDFIEIEGEKNVWEALKIKKGVILLSSHFGNWELGGIAAAAKGLPLHAIGKSHKNKFIDRYIKHLRGLTGLKTIDKNGAVQKCVRLLKQNQIIAMLIDEHAKKGNVWVNLFGQKASTSALPATLALKYHSPVIPVVFYRESNKKSKLIFGKPFSLKKSGDSQSDILCNTQTYMRHLENEIMKRPAEWTLWMHNRWRWEDNLKSA